MAFTPPGGDMQSSVYDPNNLQGSYFGPLAVSGTIDMTAVSNTTLYTVPAGFIAHPYDLVVEIVGINAPNQDSFINFGFTAASYDDYISNGFLSIGTAVGDIIFQSALMTSTTPREAGESFVFRVDSADSGTQLDVKIHLIGYLFSA